MPTAPTDGDVTYVNIFSPSLSGHSKSSLKILSDRNFLLLHQQSDCYILILSAATILHLIVPKQGETES